MAKVVYLSYEKSEGLMNSLGLEVVTLTPQTDFQGIIRQLRQADVAVIFVSEEVFSDHQEIIETYNKEFEVTISILPNRLNHHHLAQKRLKQMTEEVLGVNIS